jgi:hypothetical protein
MQQQKLDNAAVRYKMEIRKSKRKTKEAERIYYKTPLLFFFFLMKKEIKENVVKKTQMYWILCVSELYTHCISLHSRSLCRGKSVF